MSEFLWQDSAGDCLPGHELGHLNRIPDLRVGRLRLLSL